MKIKRLTEIITEVFTDKSILKAIFNPISIFVYFILFIGTIFIPLSRNTLSIFMCILFANGIYTFYIGYISIKFNRLMQQSRRDYVKELKGGEK